MSVQRLSADELTHLLLDSGRDKPVLVLSIPAGAERPLFNGPGLQREVGDAGIVVELADAQTWAFNRAMPDRARVYGGAACVYPTGTSWMHAPSVCVRRLASTRDTARRHESSLVQIMRGEDAPVWSTSSDEGAGDDQRTTIAELQSRLATRDAEVRDLKAKIVAAGKGQTQQHQQQRPERVFLDDEAQLRHELYLAWCDAVPATVKAENPLPDYGIGSLFVASMDDLQPRQRQKALRRIATLLSGLDVRDVHAMRPGGGEPLTREDGAVLMRAYVENKTASARRIHYWRSGGGRIDLSRVVLHDDYDA